MVRLRQLGSEIRHPEEIRTGMQLTMPYLKDMQAYQKYMDGDLSLLYDRMLGNKTTQNITGAQFYTETGNLGYFEVNFFRSLNRSVLAAVFQANPTVLDDDEKARELWEQDAPRWLQQARLGVEWRPGKGTSVWVLEKRYPGIPTLIAWDPEYWIPITDIVNRDLPLGHVLWRPWWSGPRVLQHDFPDSIHFNIYVNEEGADLSDGRFGPINELRKFAWSGTLDAGVVSFNDLPNLNTELKDEQSREDSERIMGVWTSGNDDSMYKTMERTVYEAILAISHMRTALTQDIRSTRIVPRVNDPEFQRMQKNPTTEFKLNPQFQIPVDAATVSGNVLGYLDPPGPEMAAAFKELYDTCVDNLPFVAGISREPEARANQSGELIEQLRMAFHTMVTDIRDDLSKVLSEAFEMKHGIKVTIGWEDEPQTNSVDKDQRILAYHEAGLISDKTAQTMGHLPIEKVDENSNSAMRTAKAEADARANQPEPGGANDDPA